jgi:ABC-2 type transport system ATP-binding protein
MVDYAVEAKSLTVVRGRATVLDNLSFAIRAGTVTGLLGPSGSGKSTLIRAIVGSQIVRSGAVEVLGHPAGSPALRRQVGYASQAASVYGDLTVAQNLRYFAAMLGAPRGDVERVMAEVHLDDLADRLTARLSGGQRSRVSLAVALLGTPRLLVLDEPTVGLDPVLREQLWSLFARLAHSDGLSLIVSSHVMDEAERCDDLLLLRDGGVVAPQSPTAHKQRTRTDNLDAAFLALIAEGVAA